MTASLLLADSAMRLVEARGEREEAAAAFGEYSSVSVLNSSGWRLAHVHDESVFPEFVYRDWLGRTVLLGSEPVPLPDGGDSANAFDSDVLNPAECGAEPGVEPREERCEERDGVLVVTMRAALRDSMLADTKDRWPRGWTEVRMESPDGRYVRLRSDSPGVDLVALAGSVEEASVIDPEAKPEGAACVLRCPVWRHAPW
ncbi:hypothetical protein J4H86_18850 [Spiractinospora alimapuensis]|uniref:hypothetical protein n=1 Tax=Spiractinospora alimapuensis TaxID=2820884 RepID=UPI001F3BCA97|nr:hypothetical protein [Spiractinospora alimapuensis]QVQ50903.1 hypothetical protein J4H86_18850 [Spiractinospora alimapuensis]